MDLTREQDVSPWQGLEQALRRAAFWSTHYENALAERGRNGEGGDLAMDPDTVRLRDEARVARMDYAKISKAAVDAGLAERYVQKIELEAQALVTVLETTIRRLGLNDEQADRARLIMSAELLEIEARGE